MPYACTSLRYELTRPQFPANISFDEAATIPLAFATAITGLWAHGEGNHSAQLATPWDEGGAMAYAGKAALIFGGSTSVGQFGTLLASLPVPSGHY